MTPLQALTRRLMGSSNAPLNSDAVIKSCKELELAVDLSQKLLRVLEKVKSAAAAKAEESRRKSEQREIKIEPLEEECHIQQKPEEITSGYPSIHYLREPRESVFQRQILPDSQTYPEEALSGSSRLNDGIRQKERISPDFAGIINPFHTSSRSDQSWRLPDNSASLNEREERRMPDTSQGRRLSPDFDAFQNPFASQEHRTLNRSIGRDSPDFTIPLKIGSSVRRYDRNNSKERQLSSFDDVMKTKREEERPGFSHDQILSDSRRQMSRDRDIQDQFQERRSSNFDTDYWPNRDFVGERKGGQNLDRNFTTLSNSQTTQNIYPDPFGSGQISQRSLNFQCQEKQSVDEPISKANDILAKAKAKLMAKRLKPSSEQQSLEQFKDPQSETLSEQPSFNSRSHFACRVPEYFGNQRIPDQVSFNPFHSQSSQAQSSSNHFLNPLSDTSSSRVFQQEFPDQRMNAKQGFSQNLPGVKQDHLGAAVIKQEKPDDPDGNPVDWDKLSFLLNSTPDHYQTNSDRSYYQ